jgi:hypothetical protein
MIKKYTIYDQLTGSNIEVSTYEEAVSVQNTLISEYAKTLKDAFAISVMIKKNYNESWTYHTPDENGDPIIISPSNKFDIPITILGEGSI